MTATASADARSLGRSGVAELLRALAGLPPDRLTRLAVALGDPDRRVIAGIWHPGCPMGLTGYAPGPWTSARTPELVFCRAWDAFAAPARRPLGLGRMPRVASRDDVRVLAELVRDELTARAAAAERRAGGPVKPRAGVTGPPAGRFARPARVSL